MHALQRSRWSASCVSADHRSSQRVVQVCRCPSQMIVRPSYASISTNATTHENPSTLSTPASSTTCHPGDRWYSSSVTIPRYVEGTKILDLEGRQGTPAVPSITFAKLALSPRTPNATLCSRKLARLNPNATTSQAKVEVWWPPAISPWATWSWRRHPSCSSTHSRDSARQPSY